MRTLLCGKKAVLLSLAPTLVNVRVTEMFEFSICLLVIFLVHVVQSVLQGNKHPIVEVKREEGCKTKATRRTNQ